MEVRAGYKQTDAGVIPKEWDFERLGVLSEFVTSGSRGWAQFYSESGALFIRSQNVRDGRLSFEDVQYVSPPTGAEGNRTKVRPNDLLITITGNSVGNVALVDQTFDEAYISQHVGLVRLKEPNRGAYVCRYLSPNSPGNPQIAGSQSGQSKPGLNLQNLKDFLIALPSSSKELQAIVMALSDVDGLLEGLDRLITKKRDLKQAAMQQLLTGQTRLPGFSGEWEERRLGELSEIVMGQSPSSSHYNTRGDGLPLIQGNADVANRETVKRVFTNQVTKRGMKGDILLSVRAPVGEVSRATFDVCLGRGVCALRFPNDFLYHLLIFLEPTWAKHSKGSTFDSVNSNDVKAVEILLPKTADEQTAIANVLSDMDTELSALEARRDKTRALKQGMMQELLTGRIRLVESGTRASEQPTPQTDGQQANIHFKRSVLAAEIIDRLHAEPTFGHVKFEKVMFLVEHLCAVDTGSTYLRKAAGPYDNRALRSIDSQLRNQQWFDCRKEGERYRYMPLEHRGGHKRYFERYFADITDTFENVLQTFKTLETERCEIVATLLSAWSDLLQTEGNVSDERIVHEVLNNWHKSKERIPKDRWMKALGWMRSRGFVPNGGAKQ